MLTFLIPPSKEMLETNYQQHSPLSINSQLIVDVLSTKTITDLEKYYRLNESSTLKEKERWNKLKDGKAVASPAINCYNGLMYRTLKSDLSDSDLDYLKQTTYITTALYGIIPIDYPVSTHRLDFSKTLNLKDKTLKQLWRPSYSKFLNDKEIVISLLSQEFETVFPPNFQKKAIKIIFLKKNAEGKLKKHSTTSKKGRGAFLRAAAQVRATTLTELKQLSFIGFTYNAELSSENTIAFSC